jgi:hypothetical protein
MTSVELQDQFWHDYLLWCTEPPSEKPSELMFWIDNRKPCMDSFWDWMLYYKKVPAKE